MRRWLVLSWVVSLALLLGACSSPSYRKDARLCKVTEPPADTGFWETADGDCKASWAVRAPSHGVNYVELDEQGMLHDRAAAEDALAYAAAPPSAGTDFAYVVVFIHGWHHDAAPDDTNVQAFHRALAAVKGWRPNADVRGIYIGWRGSSLPLPLGYLTFWERKNTSDEVGRGSLLEFLLRLERAAKPAREADGPALKPANRLVLIGHSFGASVAFNSLAHVFMQRFVEGIHAQGEGPRFRGYGDLTVLINPAIEAMRYMPLHSAVEYYATRTQPPLLDFKHETKPRLVILSSEGDLATNCSFPVARFFSMSLEAHNWISARKSPDPNSDSRYNEWNMDRDTVGNYTDFRTHWPLRIVGGEGEAAAPKKLWECAGALFKAVVDAPPKAPAKLEVCETPSAKDLKELLSQESEDPDTPAPAASEATGGQAKVRGSYFPHSNVRIVRKPRKPEMKAMLGSPYIVAGVGTEIVAGHSSVGSPNLMCWINQIVDSD